MKKLKFYTVDLDYVNYLKDLENNKRGFSRVPDMGYADNRKPKFLCGIVLKIDNIDYYVPITSYKQQKRDNFLIKAKDGRVISSLRFNYMFPVPENLVKIRNINSEQDRAYKNLLLQELKYCVRNQENIYRLAERTYKKVLLGKDRGLVENSCDFNLLEEALSIYKTIEQSNLLLNEIDLNIEENMDREI